MSMSLTHDPQARLDYQWDWTNWLASGETITSHTITVVPSAEMLVDADTATSTKVTAWLKLGVPGRTYRVTCHIVTSQTREDDRQFVLTVKDR